MEEYQRVRREFFVLLAIFLLPAIYTSAGQVDQQLFSRPMAHLGLLIQNIPRILLLLYLMELDEGNWRRRFGLIDTPSKLAPAALGVALLLLLVSLFANLIGSVFGIASQPPFQFSQVPPIAYLLSGLSLLSVGYMEELFFRAYTIRRLQQLGLKPGVAVAISALLFSMGHLYQGVQGVLFAVLAGTLLGVLYLRYERVHPLAIGHGLYNYLGLLLSGVV